MKNRKTGIAVSVITLVFVCFTVGFFTGRADSQHVISVSAPESVTRSLPEATEADDPPSRSLPMYDEDAEKDGGAFDLNLATADELASLPGIGSVLAGRIIEYRSAHGGFNDVSEIMDVSGIGEAKYLAVRDHLYVKAQG